MIEDKNPNNVIAIYDISPYKQNRVNFSVKDGFAVAGFPTTLGIKEFKTPTKDGHIVRVLKSFNWNLTHICNVPPLMVAYYTSSVFGTTYNPLREGFSPLGSSGAVGASVLTGLADIGVGSDFGGSNRAPASVMGLYSLTPRNFSPFDSFTFFDSLPPTGNGIIKNKIGFISRNLDYIDASNNKLRIAIYYDTKLYAPCATALRALNIARKLKHEIVPINFDFQKANEIYDKVLRTKEWYNQLYKDPSYKMKGKPPKINIKFPKDVDVIITPCIGFPAPNETDRTIPVSWYKYYLVPFNLLDYAFGAVPMATVRADELEHPDPILKPIIATSLGMPVGLQVAGRKTENVVQIMKELEKMKQGIADAVILAKQKMKQ